jgi:predicted GIY-YIG superfamily endonuclease
MTQPTALYRHFDAADRLLYVGISLNAVSRLAQHRDKPWFHEIVKMTAEHFATREEAEDAERQAIRDEEPIHNRQRYGAPEPNDGALPALKPNAPLAAYVEAWGMRNVEIAMGSARRRKKFVDGSLKPLDYEKWKAGGYGPDPFGIAARKQRAAEHTPSVSSEVPA